jgi:hypothetical protein
MSSWPAILTFDGSNFKSSLPIATCRRIAAEFSMMSIEESDPRKRNLQSGGNTATMCNNNGASIPSGRFSIRSATLLALYGEAS